MIKKIFAIFLISILSFSVVSARTVEYHYFSPSSDQKRIQFVWTLVPNKEIQMTEYNHEVSFPINDKNRYEIPKYTPLEKKLIDKFGSEKLNRLLSDNTINIEWNKYRFIDKNHQVVPSRARFFDDVKVEKKEVLYTNMKHSRSVLIESDIDQEVIFKLYPIPSEYHSVEYSRELLSYPYYDMPDKNNLLTLYDTTSEYHNLLWTINNNPLSLSDAYKKLDSWADLSELNSSISSLNIEKKYELIQFKRKFPIWVDWVSRSFLPYYEFKVNLSKWKNFLGLGYSTYQFPNEKIQIR